MNNTEFVENVRSLLRENSNNLLSLKVQLEVLESLQTQLAWLQEDFAEVKHKGDNPAAYFHEWFTNLHVIDALFRKTMEEVTEEYKNLRYLTEGFQDELERSLEENKKADAANID